jgi:hypothetical protein
MTKDGWQGNARDEWGWIRLGLYRHYKGGLYVVFAKSVCEATGAALVHYYSLEKRTRWTRTAANFAEKVVIDRLQEGSPISRFELIRLSSDAELLLAMRDDVLAQ